MYVVYKDSHGIDKRDDFAVGSGVVEVSHSSVKIMADMLVDIDDLDLDKAERARKEALVLMEKYKDAKDKVDMEKFIEAEDMLLKSIAQLKLGNMK
jgi:F0F1-type ATP synthase epsilon subunit